MTLTNLARILLDDYSKQIEFISQYIPEVSNVVKYVKGL